MSEKGIDLRKIVTEKDYVHFDYYEDDVKRLVFDDIKKKCEYIGMDINNIDFNSWVHRFEKKFKITFEFKHNKRYIVCESIRMFFNRLDNTWKNSIVVTEKGEKYE